MKRNPIFMRVDLLPRMVQIYLIFLILILFGLLPLNPPFLWGWHSESMELLLIGFRRIPQRILLKNLLQLSRLVEKLILSLLLVRLGCNMRHVTCVAKPRVCVAALVFTSSLFWSHCQEGLVKLCGLVCNGCVISLVRETHVTDVTQVSFWFSVSGLLTVIAPGTVYSCRQVILYHSPFSVVNYWLR